MSAVTRRSFVPEHESGSTHPAGAGDRRLVAGVRVRHDGDGDRRGAALALRLVRRAGARRLVGHDQGFTRSWLVRMRWT